MTGTHQTPLLAPAHAAVLLDQVIYEHVVACVDLDALYGFEQTLILQVGELDGMSDDRAAKLARAMIDRALLRLPGDVRCYLHAADAVADGSCCAEPGRATAPDAVGTSGAI